MKPNMRISRTGLFASLVLAGALALNAGCGNDDEDGSTGAGTIPTTDAAPSAAAGQPTAEATLTVPPANGEANNRDEFVDTIEAQLEQVQAQLVVIYAEAQSVGGNQQAEAEARLEEVNTQMAEIEAKLAELDGASDADYESMKVEIEEAVESAMTEVQELADELGT